MLSYLSIHYRPKSDRYIVSSDGPFLRKYSANYELDNIVKLVEYFFSKGSKEGNFPLEG
jgi:hypothetical protein